MRATTEQSPAANGHVRYESCEECGAPLDPQQRYCVNCAARRGNGANPSSRDFAAMSKKARRPMTRPPAKSSGSRAAAVGFFALLPIAVAIGVVVGRADSGGGDEGALLEALRQQDAAAATSGPTTAATTAAKGKAVKNAKDSGKQPQKGQGKVVAQTDNGTVHALTGFKASKEKEESDTKLVEENPDQVGSDYIKAQQNLPDVIVVGGDPSEAPAAPGGSSQP
jgi:hypothetical protein